MHKLGRVLEAFLCLGVSSAGAHQCVSLLLGGNGRALFVVWPLLFLSAVVTPILTPDAVLNIGTRTSFVFTLRAAPVHWRRASNMRRALVLIVDGCDKEIGQLLYVFSRVFSVPMSGVCGRREYSL